MYTNVYIYRHAVKGAFLYKPSQYLYAILLYFYRFSNTINSNPTNVISTLALFTLKYIHSMISCSNSRCMWSYQKIVL